MRQSERRRSTQQSLIPAALPQASESTYPDQKQMKNKRASSKLTTDFRNDGIRSVEQLLKLGWLPLLCHTGVILTRMKVLHHRHVTEASILNL